MKPRTALNLLCDGARQIIGALHPDSRDEAERRIRDARGVLYELIKQSEVSKPRKKRK